MKITDAHNNYLKIELSLKDWMQMLFEAVFTYNDGMCELFISKELGPKEINYLIDTFRQSVFSPSDNNSAVFELESFSNSFEITVSYGNRFADFRNISLAKVDYWYNNRLNDLKKTEVLFEIIAGKKDLLKAAYELECEYVKEIKNYFNNREAKS
jgi:hypothetical protein